MNKKLKKGIHLMVGCVGLGMGAIGSVVPLIPTVPFLLLAVWGFARSSERLHRWFVSTSLYKKNLESYMAGKGMTKKAKLRIMSAVTLTMGVGYVMMGEAPIGRSVLLCVWILHVLVFLFGIKNLSETEERSSCELFTNVIE